MCLKRSTFLDPQVDGPVDGRFWIMQIWGVEKLIQFGSMPNKACTLQRLAILPRNYVRWLDLTYVIQRYSGMFGDMDGVWAVVSKFCFMLKEHANGELKKFVMLGHVLLTTTFPKLSDCSCIAPIRTLVRRESPIFTVEGKGCKRLIRDFEGRSLVPFVKGVDLPQFSAWAIYPLASLSVMGGLFWLDVSLYLENLIMLSPIYRQQFVGWLVTVSGFLVCG